MENNQKALEAIKKIEKVINEVRDLFPTIEMKQIKIKVKKDSNALRILKRVDGIIKNYDKANAKRKFETLLKFLESVSSK